MAKKARQAKTDNKAVLSEASQHDLVNVVEDFDCSTQNVAYNRDFKKWRGQKDNPYAFRFKANRREKVFNDSRGFEVSSQSDEEKRIVGRIMYVLGIAVLLYVVIDTIIGKLFAVALGAIGCDVHMSIFSSALYGDVSAVVGTILFVSTLELLVPVIYIQLKLKTPARVGFMSKVNSSAEIINAVGLTFIACTLVCLPTAYSSDTKEIFAYFRTADTDVYKWGQSEFVFYTVFSIVILPIITELFVHGPIFAALRQFGDPFALIVTTCTSCLLIRDIGELPAALILSMLAGVTMLRSGTIMSAFIVSVTYRMYVFALIMFEGSTSANMLLRRNMFMLITLAAGIVISGGIYIARKIMHRKRRYIAVYQSEATPARLLLTAARTFPFTAVALICIAGIIIRAVFW
ncbi:MAG: CPBP family intramembrane metalloprotease [Ruminococcus sp.]|nr:CPBP family intramembrane metalloprotease [Ruminococcus sp.]